jgi:outer membrane immunogenic protein
MKKFLLAGVALVSLVSAASAADLAARPYTKAPPMVAPAYNWSGFYAGVMGGYAWKGSNANGGFGGGTVGYNWQAPGSQFVFGLEVDAAGSSLKQTQTQFLAFGGIPITTTTEDKVDAFGSVTGRVGVAVDASLLYFKGGYAWGDNKFTVGATALGTTISSSDSHFHSGYTVGAGWEYMFAPTWSLKAEYMYTALSSENYTIFSTVLPSGTIDFSSVKVGVNYHFR